MQRSVPMELQIGSRGTSVADALEKKTSISMDGHAALIHGERASSFREAKDGEQKTKHTAAGIPTWSPTVVLICRSTAYVWQSGRDAQFSADCGRMCLICF
jgi:hypothetical protein